MILFFNDDSSIYSNWKESVEIEIKRTRKSGHRKSHNPQYYRVVMDVEYRRKILNYLD